MTRLPYGTFKDLTPEEQRARKRMLAARYRHKHREKVNAKNKKFFDKWKIEKPFICTCTKCGNEFNAMRRNRLVCPDCHKEAHERNAKLDQERTERTRARAKRDALIIKLAKQGIQQKEIARQLNMDQRTISSICLKRGIRRNKYVARK